MALPNLKSDTLVVEPDRAVYHLTSTTLVEILAAVSSDYAYFIEQISVSNHGVVAANVTITIREGSSAGTDYEIATKRTLQVKSQFNAAQGRAHILTEGDSMWAKIETAGQSVHIVIPFTKAH